MVILNVIANSANRSLRSAVPFSVSARLFLFALVLVISAHAVDWSAPEQELSRKIVAVTGNAPISLTFDNRSSLTRRDAEIIENGIAGTLTTMGLHLGPAAPGSAAVAITLSENSSSFVWVAEIRKAGADASVVMVAVQRAVTVRVGRDSAPLTLHKSLIWTQSEPILDVAVLEENGGGPTRIAVLSSEKVSVYRLRNGGSQLEGALDIVHAKALPRDLRGRVVPSRDHLFDVYLPGVACHGSTSMPTALSCRDGNDVWPLFPNGSTTSGALFSASRNFFTGIQLAGSGLLNDVPEFYSAAWIQKETQPVWLFAAVDGQVRIFDGAKDRTPTLTWGSDIASVRTSCGAGWQVLATSPVVETADSVRAYEIPDRDPVAVSAAIEFSGPISALWTESKGDSATAVARNLETGHYEAFRLAVGCSQ